VLVFVVGPTIRNTGLDDECVGIGNMDVLENELQGDTINRIEKCLHVGADSSVSTLGHTAVAALGHTVSKVPALGDTVTRLSAMGNTAECPYWDPQLPECPHWDTQLAESPY